MAKRRSTFRPAGLTKSSHSKNVARAESLSPSAANTTEKNTSSTTKAVSPVPAGTSRDGQSNTNPSADKIHERPSNAPLATSESNPASASVTNSSGGDVDQTVSSIKSDTLTMQRKHRGNQGNFHGEHLEFLQERLEEFAKLDDGHSKTTWLSNFHKIWASKYPWHLGEEPEKFAILNDPDATVAEELRTALIKERDELLKRTKLEGQKVKISQHIDLHIH